MAVSLHTSQSGPRALFPPLTAFFESPYEKGPNWSGQSINKDQQLHPHFSTLIYYYNLKNCITSET